MKTWPHRILTVVIVGGTLTMWTIGLIRNIPSYDGSLDTIIGVSSLPTKTKHVLTLIILGAGLCIFPFVAVRAFREAFGGEKKEADPDRQRTTRGM
jgi:hypothetical protein